MHGRSSREVQTAHLVRPAGGVPRPARNRVIDERTPHKHEHHARQHPSPLRDSSNRKRNRNSRKHALINSEQQIRDFS